jgi:hypothetical protein
MWPTKRALSVLLLFLTSQGLICYENRILRIAPGGRQTGRVFVARMPEPRAPTAPVRFVRTRPRLIAASRAGLRRPLGARPRPMVAGGLGLALFMHALGRDRRLYACTGRNEKLKDGTGVAPRFIPNGIDWSEAVEIAGELGCRVEQAAEGSEIRLSHPLIGRVVRVDPRMLAVGRPAVSFLREVAGLRAPPPKVN